MKKYYIRDQKGLLHYVKAKNLEDAMSKIQHLQDSNCKDDDESETEYLSDEEKQAIEDYKEAISGTTDLKLLKLYAHILQEEIEHLEELENKDIEGE